MSIFIIDNFDSFTYNILHILEKYSENIVVKRVNEVKKSEIKDYEKILISPGPGLPCDYKILKDIILENTDKSILGICLGHQAIAEAFSCSLYNTEIVNHGVQKNTIILENDNKLFAGIPPKFLSGRYHSWAVKKENFSTQLRISAIDDEGVIMGISHKVFDIQGIQFHPESVLTPEGEKILKNWIGQKKS